jgi:glycosyltransferase involved in cell wall biosynthesis
MLCHPPDVLFVPAHVLPLIHPRRTVVTIHDLGYLKFPEAHPWQQRLYLSLSTWWNVRVASRIVADSVATKRDIIEYFRLDPAKIVVVYPGVDERLSRIQDGEAVQAVKTRYGIDGRYFLYLGRLQPRKNLSAIVRAFSRLLPELELDYRLVLAGKRGWLTNELFSLIADLKLGERVVLPGYIADRDKAVLLSGAEAFVFPSLHEGFGLPVLEAQACGCPVITSNTSSLPEVAGSAALLVDPADHVAISDAMGRIVHEPMLQMQLRKAGYQNLQRFSWTLAAQQVLDVIDGLA